MSAAVINNEVLSWARKKAGLTEEYLSDKVNKKYPLWERGELKPSFKQAQDLAKRLRIPFGYLFLSKPPKDEEQIVDLRSLSDDRYANLSSELQDVLSDAKRKQEWFSEYIKEVDGEEIEFVGKYNVDSKITDIAQDISGMMKIRMQERNDLSKSSFLKYLTDKAEGLGILVLRNGKVGSNTHRVLDLEEFRGFALIDKYAPLIFINAVDSTSAQIFTFMHELAHIWIDKEGISNNDFLHPDISLNKIEKMCNDVAAEVLVPKPELLSYWHQQDSLEIEQIDQLAKHFLVSSIVIARRALDLKLLSQTEFYTFYNRYKEAWTNRKKQNSGGDFHKAFPIANSTRFTEAICRAVYSDKIMIREAARILNVRPETIDKYARKQGLT